MNIRVDTVLPPPPEPTKTVVLTMTMEEANALCRYLKYGPDDYYSPEDKAFLRAVKDGLAAHV